MRQEHTLRGSRFSLVPQARGWWSPTHTHTDTHTHTHTHTHIYTQSQPGIEWSAGTCNSCQAGQFSHHSVCVCVCVCVHACLCVSVCVLPWPQWEITLSQANTSAGRRPTHTHTHTALCFLSSSNPSSAQLVSSLHLSINIAYRWLSSLSLCLLSIAQSLFSFPHSIFLSVFISFTASFLPQCFLTMRQKGEGDEGGDRGGG